MVERGRAIAMQTRRSLTEYRACSRFKRVLARSGLRLFPELRPAACAYQD